MRFSVPFALFVLIAFWGHSQNNAFYPTQVSKAAYFDKTPALIDMPVVEPGVRDRSWKDGLIENKSLGMGFNKNDQTPVDPSTLQGFMGSRTAKGPVVNVPGTGNVNGVYPPDTDGDVGPDHYFQMINLSFAIFDKEGNKLYGPVDNSTLWSGFPGPWSGTNDGDPIILYDEMAGRWVASQFAIYTSNNKYYEMIAVSETGDPLGAWNRYAFEFSLFPDYPKLSVWPDGYYATFHMFGSGFEGTGVAVFEREKMLAGNPDASMIYFGEYSNKFGFLPSDVDGDAPAAGTPNYVTGINFDGNKNMEIWELHANWQNPNNSTFSLAKTLTPASFNANINGIAQPGTSNKLDAISSVLMFRLPFRDFGSYRAMVANHTVNVSGRAGVRWYELRDNGTGWTIYQQGTYAPGAENRWMGSIAMAANGNIALGYSVSGSNVYPSIRYTGRTPNAPLGEMNLQEIEIIAGGSSQTGINRWGDYSCMAVDPYTDTTFWFTTEYMKSAGWGTRIASFDFSTIEQPTAYAGQDTAICENELFITQGNATNYASVLWETSGDGVFQNATSVNAKYLRGNQDIENGSVTLTLNVTGYLPGQEAGDEMELTITKEAEANAGPDQTINEGETAYLSGSAENYVTVHWSSSGDGTFSGNNTLETEYTPGINDVANGAAELSLQAYPG
ncbi:MAG: hypothetical protein JXA03_14035, partial [Bacteroidales bacterium]|nr:hypothetical protein [Bacteroidales bacterium]